jgi:hypothetical protein
MSNVVNAQWMGGLKPIRYASLRGGNMEQNKKCSGNHYIYVAEVLYVQKDAKLVVINVCRACGEVSFHEKQVSTPGTPADLLKEKEKENEL